MPGAIAGDAMSDPFDAAELLDVDVDHLAEQGLLIADDLNFRIEVGEAAQPLGVADAGHGRARQPGLAGDFPERLTVPAQGFDRHDLLG